MEKAIKTLLSFAIIIVVVMTGLALFIPGEIFARQLAFLVLAFVALIVLVVVWVLLFYKETTPISKTRNIVSQILVLVAILACGSMILVVFLNSGDLYARYGSMWLLPIVSIVSLIVVYRLQFGKR